MTSEQRWLLGLLVAIVLAGLATWVLRRRASDDFVVHKRTLKALGGLDSSEKMKRHKEGK